MITHSHLSRHTHGFHWWARRLLLGAPILVVTLGMVAWLAGSIARSHLAKQHPIPGQLVDVGGYHLHIHCTGHGTTSVIMDAGLNDFSVQWVHVQPEVARFARVCVYDRAGLGWSQPGPLPRTSATMVRELRTLLHNANIPGPYVLVGHSFGGMNMRLFAHHYPDEVSGLVLVDAAHEEQTRRVESLQQVAAQTVAQFRTLARLSAWGLLAAAPQNIPARGLPDQARDRYRALLATTPYFETAIAETSGLEQSFAEVRAAGIRSLGSMPLVVLSRGLSDPLPGISEAANHQYEAVWHDMQTELAALSSNSRHVCAVHSAHSIQLQQPDLVVEAIRHVAEASHPEMDPMLSRSRVVCLPGNIRLPD